MIRKNTIYCKLFNLKKLKKSGFDIYGQSCHEASLLDETCPSCGCKGSCSPYGHYSRYLVDFEDGRPCCRQLTVTRVMCSCGATHAILPDPIVPYLHYSLFFILTVLAIYSCHIMSVERICEAYQITPPTLYRWVKTYNDHRREWQGLLAARMSDIRHSLYGLVHKSSWNSFSAFFTRKTGMSFLQTHANPANCRQNLQFRFFPGAVNTT